MTDVEKAKTILSKIRYINIASVSVDGQPWNTPVSAFFDDQLNFYWASWKENQHSKNIRSNPNIFLTVYDSTAAEGTGEGVYMQAKAFELSDPDEINRALAFRDKKKKARQAEEYLGEYPRRLYKAVPEKFWLNGDGEISGNFVDVRIEVKMK